ncbi:CotH protein [Pseudobythopirellula maris]|uniref:CotH protein n=1 Tax=Pseudobythopirellula maris TaxID=2527991 RepID=A0A5C5ZHB8_9BACT|nr:CotH protein [Pseudobythopirellula maris]
MASNGGAVLDGYGATSDWIELHNHGDEEIDLVGWGLTDDEDELDKWSFPSTTIEAGGYLLVFASGADTVDPLGYRHTSFSLSADGEYLALVDPQGEIRSEFGADGEDYPAQLRNRSHGLGFDSTHTEVVSPDSAVRYWVPTDNSVDATWMLEGFDDSAWHTGEASLGFEDIPNSYADLIQTTLESGTQSVYVRIPFESSEADALLDRLSLRYDDGFVAYLNGVEIASDHAPETPGFDSLATELRPREAATGEAVFSLTQHSGLLQEGTNVLSLHVMGLEDGDLLAVPRLSLASGELLAPQLAGNLIAATPGAPNTQLSASDVVFSHPGGVFVEPFELTLTSAHVNETIRYTTDGSVPTATSPVYPGPLLIEFSTHVRARAFGPLGQVGDVVSGAFSQTSTEIGGFTSDLPVIVLEGFGGGLPGADFEDASFSLYKPDAETGRTSLSADPEFTSSMGYHRRGSSTFDQVKPNFRIELRDESGEDRNAPLLGMPANSDWILYAPHHLDKAMIRNGVMYDLSEQMGHYAIRTRYVEVIVNHNGNDITEGEYRGVYVLMENIKIDEGRVEVDKLTPADNAESEITGGYIIKFDRPDQEEDAIFHTSRGTPMGTPHFVHVDPERAEMTQAQTDYIRGYFEDFENALYGPDWKDPSEGYAQFLDVESAIDHHLLRIFSGEVDMMVLSEHMHKSRDGKLAFGPVWDFDRSSGHTAYQTPLAESWQPINDDPFQFA